MSKKLEEARQFHEPLQELLANILTAAEKAKSQSASRHTAYSREIILEARKTAAEDAEVRLRHRTSGQVAILDPDGAFPAGIDAGRLITAINRLNSRFTAKQGWEVMRRRRAAERLQGLPTVRRPKK